MVTKENFLSARHLDFRLTDRALIAIIEVAAKSLSSAPKKNGLTELFTATFRIAIRPRP